MANNTTLQKHRYDWFRNRLGKRIYLVATTCLCEWCIDYQTNGFINDSKFDVYYTFQFQQEAGRRYADKPLSKITQSIE